MKKRSRVLSELATSAAGLGDALDNAKLDAFSNGKPLELTHALAIALNARIDADALEQQLVKFANRTPIQGLDEFKVKGKIAATISTKNGTTTIKFKQGALDDWQRLAIKGHVEVVLNGLTDQWLSLTQQPVYLDYLDQSKNSVRPRP